MKKKLLSMAFVSLLAAATFCACNKDDDDTTTETAGTSTIASGNNDFTIVNASEYSDIDTAKLTAYHSEGRKVFSSAPIIDGKFTINFPESIDDKYLVNLTKYFEIEKDGITVTPSDAKMGEVDLYGYKANDEYGTYNRYIIHQGEGWKGFVEYVNKDVTVTGSYSEGDDENKRTYKYSYNLKKGWNICYKKDTKSGKHETEEYTTTPPAGALWYFDDK
ncbi:MAG: hypothetical protein LBT49_01260 [Prevotellaceae bacterium]|jgi:hypothetical protein|nr:hypothetical protein [Prevotellaceae bacterium]